ncbi:helix-turn-helix transcriptional regulator [Nocardioides sp. YIM 152588]|uniref:helix-turn-helix domain-containing protein n=1 Tax=Nocardioides sp. YIM 152588 TaxID=3158259 RepID=UPI0032E48C16
MSVDGIDRRRAPAPAPRATPQTTPFGAALRRWRTTRGLSQLALSVATETTSRHVSFLETGRSRPSRGMVGRLAEALDLSLRERNQLFAAAGLAPAFPESALDSEEMAAFRYVVDRMLESHEPFPAYAVDGHWDIVRTNRAAARFLEGTDERNVVRLTYAGAWRELIDNWADIAWVGIARLRAEVARFPHDEQLAALADLALDAAGDLPRPTRDVSPRVLCPVFRVGDDLVRTISVVAQFGAPTDITLDELRIELVHPADEASRRFFELLAGRSP